MEFSYTLQPSDWNLIDRITDNQADTTSKLASDTHIKKFGKYNSEQHPQKLQQKKNVINLSKSQFTEAQVSVLSKGFNFAVAPKNFPVETIISSVEPALFKLDSDVLDDTGMKVTNIVIKAKPPQCNISRPERQALQEIRCNTLIVVIPTDKGNVTVILNKMHCVQ